MRSTKRSQLKGQALGCSQNSTFVQSTPLMRTNFSFLFAHDRTGHEETILTKALPKETLMREIAQFSTCFKRNKGYNYPMICAVVKFNFTYELESLHKNCHLEVKTTVEC